MKHILSLAPIPLLVVSCLQTVKEPSTAPPVAPAETASSLQPVAGQPANTVKVGTVHRHDGSRFQPASLTKNPEYYLLYFSASW